MQILSGHWAGASGIMSWMLWFNFYQEFRLPDLQYLEPQTRLKKKKHQKNLMSLRLCPLPLSPWLSWGTISTIKCPQLGPRELRDGWIFPNWSLNDGVSQ